MNEEKNQTPKYQLRQQVTQPLSSKWICSSWKRFHYYKTVEIMEDGKKRWNWFLLTHEALYSNSIALYVQFPQTNRASRTNTFLVLHWLHPSQNYRSCILLVPLPLCDLDVITKKDDVRPPLAAMPHEQAWGYKRWKTCRLTCGHLRWNAFLVHNPASRKWRFTELQL